MVIIRPGLRPLYSFEVAPVQTNKILEASFSNSEAIPLRIPSPIPSRITKIYIPEATESPVRNVRNLFLLIASNISCHRSTSNIAQSSYLVYFGIICNYTVLKSDNSFGHLCNIMLVGHY